MSNLLCNTSGKRHIHLSFETDINWLPKTAACWTECPFSRLIRLGERCRCLEDDGPECPFVEGEANYLNEEDSNRK